MKRRRTPPLWLSILLLIAIALIVWLRTSDAPGDRGMANVGTMLLTVLAVGIAFAWFLFLSGFEKPVRWTVLLCAVLALFAAASVLRFEGFSGAMVPLFTPRFADDRRAPAATAAGERDGAVDLLATTPEDFPGFLGPRRDGTVDRVRLARDWTARPPERLWRRPIGMGWSAFAVVNGYAATMEQRPASGGGAAANEQLVTLYDVTSGELCWSSVLPGEFDHFLGGAGPRSTPTIDGGRVYALGAWGRLVCLDGATGELVWERDLLEEYGVTREQEVEQVQYGRSNSPLVHGELVIVPAGGTPGGRFAGLAAFDKESGELAWESPGRHISFSSPNIARLAGVEQVLIVNEDTLSGHAPDTGAMLWEHPWPGVTSANASVSQAVPVPPDRVLVSKGYGGGASLLRLHPTEGAGLRVEALWHVERSLRTKFTNVVVREDHAYGLSDGILECVALDTGKRVWKEGRFEHGQILLVGDVLLVLSEEGELALVEATPHGPEGSDEEGRVLGRMQALDGKTWNNLALYGDVLLARNASEATALRLPTIAD